LAAAASFKHVSPAGAAVSVPMSELVKRASFVEDLELSPLATAYARARGADRLCSFGDWAAMSEVVDVSTANILKREVSDGVIAPGYEPEALEILKTKRKGSYCVIEVDPSWEAPELETREVFGVSFEQRRNTVVPNAEHLAKVVTRNQTIPEAAKRDLLLALITLKYTQSNSVCLAYEGQAIGIGAGQQSRVHCIGWRRPRPTAGSSASIRRSLRSSSAPTWAGPSAPTPSTSTSKIHCPRPKRKPGSSTSRRSPRASPRPRSASGSRPRRA
jgi:phosphoribosylaminoimidazolecarboxamide formyltransferase/IMP cyclohydrolase